MNKRRSENKAKKDSSGVFLWTGTIVAVLAILGGSFFIASKKQAQSLLESKAPPSELLSVSQSKNKKMETLIPAEPVKSIKDQTDTLSLQPATKAPEPPETAPSETLETLLSHLSAPTVAKQAGTLKLKLTFMEERDKIPLEHTCFRANTSPALSWEGAPPETKSYVIMMHKAEKDEERLLNWIVFDIPSSEKELPANLPKIFLLSNGGKQARSNGNSAGYNGPCESNGSIPYSLRLFALDTILNLPPETTDIGELIHAIDGHVIDNTLQEFIHYYKM